MNIKTSRASTSLFVACIAMLGMTMVTGASAAADAPTAVSASAGQSIAELQQPDEILAYGRSLASRIVVAEDEFFGLYNRRNKDAAYRVSCGKPLPGTGGMIVTRKCGPAYSDNGSQYSSFVSGNYYSNGYVNYPSSNTGEPCATGMVAGPDSSGTGKLVYMYSGCEVTAAPYTVHPSYLSGKGGYSRDSYRENLQKVVRSDFRLRAMAANLSSLYEEMASLQDRYDRVGKLNKSVQ